SVKIYVQHICAADQSSNLQLHLSLDKTVSQWYQGVAVDGSSDANTGWFNSRKSENTYTWDVTSIVAGATVAETISNISNCELLCLNNSNNDIWFDYFEIEVVYKLKDVVVDAAPGLTTTEAGGEATFQVYLTKQPSDTVTVDLASSNPAEGVIDKSNLTFTTSDWATWQTVTITGQEDTVEDGNIHYTIQVGPVTSNDPDYAAIDPPDVSVRNMDDELDANLVAWWKLDETSGTTALDSVGTNDGTLNDMSGTEWTAGIKGGALRFDGSADDVRCDDGDGFMRDAFSVRSFALWVNADTTTGARELIDEGGGTQGLAVRINNDFLEAAVVSGGTQFILSTPYAYVGEWHHVAVVYDSGAFELYLDGSPVESVSTVASYTTVANHDNNGGLGQRLAADAFGASSNNNFDGLLDDFRMYDDALTATEVLDLAKVPPEIRSAVPPVGYVNVAYSHTFTGVGVPAPAWTLVAEANLPAGLSWNAGTATISGMPTAVAASPTITVTAT
ncbi:unnamed protein product, partial [marine sediment metagenome]